MKLKLWYSLLLSIFLTGAIATRAKSQITPDGTTNTTVNSTDSTTIIAWGDRAEDNPFHSFEQFDLPNDNKAFFNNKSDIANIFSRKTEENISEIEGLIKAVEQNLCQQGRGSEFVVTGKGGTAPSPIQVRDRDVSVVDLVKPVFSEAGQRREPHVARDARDAGEAKKVREIIEAKRWIVNDRGMVELVASKTDIYSNYSESKVQCHQPGTN